MFRDGVSRVVLADRDVARRNTTATGLRRAGHVVEATSDVMHALHFVHKSAYPLIVVLTSEYLHVLNVAASDRRLTHHHAYIVLAPATDQSPDCARWYPHVMLRVLRLPVEESLLHEVIAKAARTLGLEPAG